MNKSREIFLEDVRGLIKYWQQCESKNVAVEGVAHSILCLLDGVGGSNMAGYTVINNETKEKVTNDYGQLHDDLV